MQILVAGVGGVSVVSFQPQVGVGLQTLGLRFPCWRSLVRFWVSEMVNIRWMSNEHFFLFQKLRGGTQEGSECCNLKRLTGGRGLLVGENLTHRVIIQRVVGDPWPDSGSQLLGSLWVAGSFDMKDSSIRVIAWQHCRNQENFPGGTIRGL